MGNNLILETSELVAEQRCLLSLLYTVISQFPAVLLLEYKRRILSSFLHSFDADLVSGHITHDTIRRIRIEFLSCISPALLCNHPLTHDALFLHSPWTVTDGAKRIRFRTMLQSKTNEKPLSNRP